MIDFRILVATFLVFSGCIEEPCDNLIICLNGGVEVTQGNECFCECPVGFFGPNCESEEPCELLVCQNGGSCEDGKCNCLDNYTGDNCEINLCKDVNCLNGGFCDKGTCNCPDGFEGEDCSKVIDLLIGDWYAEDNCFIASPTPYCATFENDENFYTIKNFRGNGNLSGITFTSETDIMIFEQKYDNAEVFGFGQLSLDKKTLLITYLIETESTTFPCAGTWIRK